MRIALLAAALLGLAACADPASSRIDSANALSRAVDHDTETTLPSADSNLRAIPPGRPPPVENGWGATHF